MVTLHSSSKDSRFVRLSFGDVPGGSDPASAIINGGLGLIAAGMTSSASKYAARKYLEGVEKTNATNLQLAHEQQDWDLAQWHRENEYNSASSQLQRWQDAGFSPQSFIQVGDPGNAASLQSPDLANQIPPPDTSGFESISAQSIMQGIKGASDATIAWREMKLKQDSLNLEKERLANETAMAQADVSYKQALSDEARAHIKLMESQAKMTDSQRYQFDSVTELNWQKWQQLAQMFPLEYRSKQLQNALGELDRVLSERTLQDRIAKAAADLNWSIADTKLKVKQAMYWATQAEEGNFQIATQPLRFDLLNWKQQQVKFDLDFAKNTRYSQLRFENMMKAAHAAYELGSLAVDVAGELRAWIHPSSYTWNYNFQNPSGQVIK